MKEKKLFLYKIEKKFEKKKPTLSINCGGIGSVALCSISSAPFS